MPFKKRAMTPEQAEEIRIQENEHEEENFNCNTDLQ